MTDKAQAILNRLKRRRVLDKTLNAFNQDNLDPVGPVGGQKGEKFLAEMNELQEFENELWGQGQEGN